MNANAPVVKSPLLAVGDRGSDSCTSVRDAHFYDPWKSEETGCRHLRFLLFFIHREVKRQGGSNTFLFQIFILYFLKAGWYN